MLHRRHHLTAAILISVTVVGGILVGLLFFFRPWETPNYALQAMLDQADATPGYVVNTTGDLVLKGKTESVGGTWTLGVTAKPRENKLTDYDATLSGTGTYRVGDTRSTFRGMIDARIVDGRLYVRLTNYDLSNDLQPKWHDYLAIYRGVWYELPEDALAALVKNDADTLTRYFATTGLLQPIKRTPTGGDTQITVGLNSKILEALVKSVIHPRGLALLPDETPTKMGENPTGGEIVWRVDDDDNVKRIDGRLSSANDSFGGSIFTLTFTSEAVTKPSVQIAQPENVKAYDVRKVLF